jgi:metal-responsive CopG/Arc/MetJ family transcriptional regulator
MRQKRQKEPKANYVTVKIPKELIMEMDRLIGSHGFRSRAEIAKAAIRQLLRNYVKENEKKE